MRSTQHSSAGDSLADASLGVGVFNLKQHSGVTIASTSQQVLKDADAQELNQKLSAAAQTGPVGVDMTGITHVGSPILGAFLSINNARQRHAGQAAGAAARLNLCNVDPGIAEVLNITKLNKLFTVHATVPDLLEAVKASGVKK